MTAIQDRSRADGAESGVHVDAVVVGAGFAGLYALHKLRDEMDLDTKVIEAAGGVGGTWYWNRYPGARTDSESHYYCYSFSKELLHDWEWTERFASQPEVLAYLEHVASRFDLHRSIDFEHRVESARWDDTRQRWSITTDAGEVYTARYFVSAMGILSAPYRPAIPGIDTFAGEILLTARWPREDVALDGKRIGVIGTGSTGIQLVPELARRADHVFVFQRTPNFVIEANNRTIDPVTRQDILARYDEIWERVHNHPAGMPFTPPGRSAVDADAEELRQVYEHGWSAGAFHFLYETFDDVRSDLTANKTAADFVRDKIRSTVRDPRTAERLMPVDYPLGAKRVPVGHRYFETFNRDNVTLVDLREEPIRRMTAAGLDTSESSYPLDMLVFATGFDAFSGALRRIDVEGRPGHDLRTRWADGPRTLFGVGVHGFPNMFLVGGPLSPFANIPPSIETQVDWICSAIRHMRGCGATTMEASATAVDIWVRHTNEVAESTLLPLGTAVRTWMSGANIPGRTITPQVYLGGANRFRTLLEECAAKEFEGWELSC